jgi:hypothetical protein
VFVEPVDRLFLEAKFHRHHPRRQVSPIGRLPLDPHLPSTPGVGRPIRTYGAHGAAAVSSSRRVVGMDQLTYGTGRR